MAKKVFSERSYDCTPNGGAYTEMYYLDEKDKPCDKRQARRFRALEYDKNDHLIMSTSGFVGKSLI